MKIEKRIQKTVTLLNQLGNVPLYIYFGGTWPQCMREIDITIQKQRIIVQYKDENQKTRKESYKRDSFEESDLRYTLTCINRAIKSTPKGE